jgi:DNA-binding MarR family transcriptional regulator
MAAAFRALLDIDRTVNEPARLAILNVLDVSGPVTFLFLRAETGLLTGNLSSHLTRLEAAGLIEILKSHRGRRSHTDIQLTFAGREALQRHWTRLEDALTYRRAASNHARANHSAP